ncbi:CPBP family intramembrane glutamic endopeptidase [Bacillus massilinigeriensis]|uniref:CPBP family intramembrane glutamic endopeptidase n=1 Tax=Bacillus mediterraneensis TaxID=1805474 RepID=UPI0008F85675|nr:type II CAAX endopeptidase family protein [Bacillus mediterraneensis]
MKKTYSYILIIYILMQFSAYLGLPLTFSAVKEFGYSAAEAKMLAGPIWTVFSFSVTLILVVFLLRKERKAQADVRGAAGVASSIIWAIAGVFLAFAAQVIAANIEIRLFGVDPGSENTRGILEMIKIFLPVMFITSVIGPILEEIVFRKIIFGSLYHRFGFLLSALISSVIFSLAHGEPQHLLLYSAMGFTFAFLYVKTKRILVPIFAHVAMNTFVILVQSVYKEDIERMMREAEQIQGFIGGLFL